MRELVGQGGVNRLVPREVSDRCQRGISTTPRLYWRSINSTVVYELYGDQYEYIRMDGHRPGTIKLASRLIEHFFLRVLRTYHST